eukprot:6188295-Pleurochrysis_carterae.AAC.2
MIDEVGNKNMLVRMQPATMRDGTMRTQPRREIVATALIALSDGSNFTLGVTTIGPAWRCAGIQRPPSSSASQLPRSCRRRAKRCPHAARHRAARPSMRRRALAAAAAVHAAAIAPRRRAGAVRALCRILSSRSQHRQSRRAARRPWAGSAAPARAGCRATQYSTDPHG